MRFTETAAARPRVFIGGVIAGSLQVASGFMLALLATGHIGAANGSVYHACVSFYSGQVRIVPPNRGCSSGEYSIELGSADAAANLTWTVATGTQRDLDSGSASVGDLVQCPVGQMPVTGGIRTYNAQDSRLIIPGFLTTGASGPHDSLPHVWMVDYGWEGGPFEGYVEPWALCLS